MKDSSKYFACYINTKNVPMTLNCSQKFNNLKSAEIFFDEKLGEPIVRNNSYMTTVIPLCKYIPDFINTSRAYNLARNTLVKNE